MRFQGADGQALGGPTGVAGDHRSEGRWLLRRLPLPRQPLRLGDLRARHKVYDPIKLIFGLKQTLRRRQVEPHVSENEVRLDTLAPPVGHAEVGLSGCIALLRSLTVVADIRRSRGERVKSTLADIRSQAQTTRVSPRMPLITGKKRLATDIDPDDRALLSKRRRWR